MLLHSTQEGAIVILGGHVAGLTDSCNTLQMEGGEGCVEWGGEAGQVGKRTTKGK